MVFSFDALPPRLRRAPWRRIVIVATAEDHRMAGAFRIKLLPAQHGDCIWIEYGEQGATRHVLVDGGPLGAFGALRAHVESLPADARDVELLVVTHIDADHIDGIVKLLRHPELNLRFREVWFNGWPQLERALAGGAVSAATAANTRGPVSGSALDLTLVRGGQKCNERFRGFAALVASDGDLPRVQLPGGLELTLLSPTMEKLQCLRATWLKTFEKLGAAPDDEAFIGARLDRDARFRGEGALPPLPGGIDEAADAATTLDGAVANGSSIAFVAEYQGRRCAFLGDAHAPVVQQALGRMARERGEEPLRLDAVKVSHHGSDGNTTTLLLQKLACRNFLISTNGSVFKHPDDAAIARIVKHAAPARLYFNYLSDYNRKWSDTELQRQGNFQAVFPPEGAEGIEIDLLAIQ
jgi:hypothetical protein